MRKVELDVDRRILPGLLQDPDAMARAIDDTTVHSESDPPPTTLRSPPSSLTIPASAYSPLSREADLTREWFTDETGELLFDLVLDLWKPPEGLLFHEQTPESWEYFFDVDAANDF